jgi:hypothetical protein
MVRSALPGHFVGAGLVVATLFSAGSAAAYTIVPADDETGRVFVVIERPYGDVVPLRLLPRPHDRILPTARGEDALVFRWRYWPSRDEGRGHLDVSASGEATMHFAFTARRPRAGDTLAAAAVLTGADGRALHTLFARARLSGESAEAGPERRTVALRFERRPEWWEKVEAITFFNMSYPAERGFDDEGVWTAMRRAVHRLTRGEGSEQRG